MKKNRAMRIAALLLVLTMMTSCFVGGTFAKYTVGTNTTADTARVAKWGVTVEGTGVAFSDSYKDTATTYAVNEALNTITVQSVTEGEKVIAPGTNGTLAAFEISGAPEVDTEVTYSAELTLTGWEIAGAVYCPIVFTITVNGTPTEYKIGGAITDTAALELAVETAIVNATQTYHTNNNLSNAADDLKVEWAWAFETGDNDDEKAANNAKDTALGDMNTAPTISLKVDCTINQLN